MNSTIPPHILLLDKPAGMTSFDVIRQLRRQTGVRKFGHAGTLDPAATGLLLLGVGPGTKTLTSLTKLDKVYEAVIQLGTATTSSDRDGEIIEQVAVPAGAVVGEQVENALAPLVGSIELPVSAYSAIKRDGVPMYKRARQAAKRGEVVTDVPIRTMDIYEATLLTLEEQVVADVPQVLLSVRFHVGSGTYIRSLAEALGQSLGYPAMLAALRRTKIGEYSVADAVLPEVVQDIVLS